jgi:hypothetical protein
MRLRLPLTLGFLAALAALTFGIYGCGLLKGPNGPTTIVQVSQDSHDGTPTPPATPTPNAAFSVSVGVSGLKCAPGTNVGASGPFPVGCQVVLLASATFPDNTPAPPAVTGNVVTWTSTGGVSQQNAPDGSPFEQQLTVTSPGPFTGKACIQGSCGTFSGQGQ